MKTQHVMLVITNDDLDDGNQVSICIGDVSIYEQ